jgi:uncharacterized repeat protein (TIGR03803 family)
MTIPLTDPFSALYSFSNGSDGAAPLDTLLLSGSTLYGTASAGGNYGYGSVFSLDTSGSGFTSLYSFGVYYPYDGAVPYGGLALSGNTLYGTTSQGGFYSWGSVFQINTDASAFATIYSFEDFNDGGNPDSGLVVNGGELYGTTTGGTANAGTVFKLKAP